MMNNACLFRSQTAAGLRVFSRVNRAQGTRVGGWPCIYRPGARTAIVPRGCRQCASNGAFVWGRRVGLLGEHGWE